MDVQRFDQIATSFGSGSLSRRDVVRALLIAGLAPLVGGVSTRRSAAVPTSGAPAVAQAAPACDQLMTNATVSYQTSGGSCNDFAAAAARGVICPGDTQPSPNDYGCAHAQFNYNLVQNSVVTVYHNKTIKKWCATAAAKATWTAPISINMLDWAPPQSDICCSNACVNEVDRFRNDLCAIESEHVTDAARLRTRADADWDNLVVTICAWKRRPSQADALAAWKAEALAQANDYSVALAAEFNQLDESGAHRNVVLPGCMLCLPKTGCTTCADGTCVGCPPSKPDCVNDVCVSKRCGPGKIECHGKEGTPYASSVICCDEVGGGGFPVFCTYLDDEPGFNCAVGAPDCCTGQSDPSVCQGCHPKECCLA